MARWYRDNATLDRNDGRGSDTLLGKEPITTTTVRGAVGPTLQHQSQSVSAFDGQHRTGPSLEQSILTSSIGLTHSLNAISPSPSHSHLAVGGRELLKILALNPSGDSSSPSTSYSLKPTTNLRVGKINRNYGVIDLKWHHAPSCDQYLATAPTNGAVVIWNLGKSHSKMERIFKEHSRTVNRVCWQPNEFHTLWSGSQDGTVRMWDIRDSKSARVFQCNGEVRDLQVSPFHNTFVAVGTEAGTIQIWDIRKANTPHSSIAAHDGLVLSVKWHPRYKSLIASGGRDRMVKVWDLGKTSRPKYAIQTISTVSRILWRPNYPHQLTTASTISDNAVHVWDIHRPYLPILSYRHHTDVVTGMFWLHGAPNHIVTCSKDSQVAVQMFQDAEQPRTTMRAVDFDTTHTNDVVFVSESIDRTPLEPSTFKLAPLVAAPNSAESSEDGTPHLHNLSQHGSANNDILMIHDESDMHQVHQHFQERSFFEYFARHYIFFDPKYGVSEKCLINAKASESIQDYQKEKVWLLLRLFYMDYKERLDTPNTGQHSDANSDLESQHETFDEDEDEESDLDDDTDEDETNDLFLPSRYMDVDESAGMDEDLLNVELQNEPTFFEKDDDSDDGALYNDHPAASQSFGNNFFVESPSNWQLIDGQPSPTIKRPLEERSTAEYQNESAASAPQFRFIGPYSKTRTNTSQKNTVNIVDLLSPSISNTIFEETVMNLLDYYSEIGDIQMCVAITAVLAETNLKVSPRALVEWQLCYIDMLRRRKLFLYASQIIKYSSETQIRNMSLNNTTIHSSCSQCFKAVEKPGQMVCEKCNKKFMCYLCHQSCSGMWFFCQKCGCGGHLACMMDIVKKQGRCPKCGTSNLQGV